MTRAKPLKLDTNSSNLEPELELYKKKKNKKKIMSDRISCRVELVKPIPLKKSRIRELPNLLTDAESSTNIFVSAGIKKGADSMFFCPIKSLHPMPSSSPPPKGLLSPGGGGVQFGTPPRF